MAASTPSSHGIWQWLRRASGAPARAASGTPAPPPAKHQRAANRERLFGVVRENMIRAGVLSSTYKFKVLTLDPAGQQFIVMVDWQPGAARTDAATGLMLEQGLQQLARERLGFRVKAVYWRHASAKADRAQAPEPATPAPAPAVSRPAAPADPHAVSDDELLAFRAALRSPEVARPAAAPDPGRGDAVDFQPTVITDDAPSTDFGALSETQFGKLK